MRVSPSTQQTRTLDYGSPCNRSQLGRIVRRCGRLLLVALIAAVAWTLLVKRSYHAAMCKTCGYQYSSDDISFAAIVVRRRICGTYISPCQSYAEALGKPCPHADMVSLLTHRAWGLWLYELGDGWPHWLQSDDLPDENELSAVRRLAAAEPDLAETYYHRVIENRDYDYYRQLRHRANVESGDATVAPSSRPHP